MDEETFRRYLADTIAGVEVVIGSAAEGSPEISRGDTFFFHDPTALKRRADPFAIIVTKDYGEFADASDRDRPGVRGGHSFLGLNCRAGSRHRGRTLLKRQPNGRRPRTDA